MKNTLLSAILILVFGIRVEADFLVQPNDVVGIGGDSITEQHLYSSFMGDYLLMCQPTQGQSIVNFGWSGEQAPAFLSRLGTDVFPFKPTVMTTCYGMNDGHYGPINDDIASTYRKAQTGIVEALKSNGVRVIVLGSAKCVDTYYYHNRDTAGAAVYNQTLASLADIDKDIASKEGVIYADVYGNTLKAMQQAKAKFGDDYEAMGGDGVHPNPNGHLVMAYTFLKALGCDGNIGTITVEFGLQQATGTDGQEIVSYKDGTVDVKSTRYPFCFDGTPDSKDPAYHRGNGDLLSFQRRAQPVHAGGEGNDGCEGEGYLGRHNEGVCGGRFGEGNQPGCGVPEQSFRPAVPCGRQRGACAGRSGRFY